MMVACRKILLAVVLFAIPVLATHVAVLETISEKDVLGRSEKMFLTDKLREHAKDALPSNMGYIVMTRENINAMLPPGKSIEECEGTCLVETGKNIAADYVAQARVGRFGSQYTLTMELYETSSGNLVGSFTTRKPDADGLLEEIETRADEIFKLVLKTNTLIPSEEEDEISHIKIGGNARSNVRIESKPSGAELSIDGLVKDQCSKTPCEINLPFGDHRFAFSLDGSVIKDTIINVSLLNQVIKAKIPKYGILLLQPVIIDKMASIDSFEVKIDGELMHAKRENKYHLSAGNHTVELSHRCYENVSFEVSIKAGKKTKFDYSIQPIMSKLNLKVMGTDGEINAKIYVNGKLKGKSPIKDELVPICAKITTGKRKNVIIPVKFEARETVSYTHNLSSGYTDPRDGQSYKIVLLGDKIWFGENLNYRTDDSWCYQNKPAFCQKYGRLYPWKAAVDACPMGWHLPSLKEYHQMISAMGFRNKDVAANSLKSGKDWLDNGNGIDDWSFSAMPAGGGLYGTNPENLGRLAYFWTSTDDYGDAFALFMAHDDIAVHAEAYEKNNGYSVRCVKD